VVGWMISSAIFLRINRTGLSGPAAVAASVVAGLTMVGFWALWQAHQLTLVSATFLLLGQEYVQIAVLIALLWRKRLPLPRLALFSALLALASVGLYGMGVGGH